MMKRITSALMALLILISVLPIGVSATDTGDAEIGETVEMPAKENPGNGWEPDADNWVQRGCDLEGHVHDASCVSADNVLICQIPEGTHIHDQNCGYYDVTYQWVYTGKVTKAAAQLSFVKLLKIRNVDPQGNPVAVDDESQQAKFWLIDKNGAGSLYKYTDSNGAVQFDKAWMDNAKATNTLMLTQDAAAFQEGGKLAEKYKHNTATYTITAKKKSGKYYLYMTGDSFVETDDAYILTVVNEPRMGMLTVNMDLTYPDGMEQAGEFTVKVNEEPMALTEENQWQTPLNDLDWGNYTVTLVSSTLPSGYELSNVSYKVEPYNGEASTSTENGTVTFSEDGCTAATVTITGEVTRSMPKYVQLRTQDERGNLLVGASVGIFLSETAETPERTLSDAADGKNDGVIELDLESYIGKYAAYLGEGQSITAYLKQTAAPECYDLSSQTFEMTATKTNGKIYYNIPGVEVEGETMKAAFVHEAQLGTVNVTMEFPKGIPDGITQIPVVISGGSITKELTLSADNGWTAQVAELPLGTYTVTQNDEAAQAEDYTLTTAYENQTVTLEKDGDSAACTVTNTYTTPSNTVIVRAADEEGTLLKDITLELLNESGEVVRRISCNGSEVSLTDLEELAQEGQTLTYTLQPENENYKGYETAAERYIVTVKNSNNRVTVRVRKDANFLVRLFSDGVDEGENGEQIIAFTYEAIRGDLTVKMEPAGEDSGLDSVTARIIGLEQNPMEQTLEFNEENNWQVTLEDVPLGSYQIVPENVEGYDLTTTEYQAEGGSVANGVLTLDETASGATLTVSNTYTPIAEAEEVLNTLVIHVKDDLGNYLPGAAVGLYLEHERIDTIDLASMAGIGPFKDKDDGAEDGVIRITGLKEMVKKAGKDYGEMLSIVGSITLKQYTRPTAMKDSQKDALQSYKIYVTKTSDGFDYGIDGVTAVDGQADLPLEYEVDKGTLSVQAKMIGAPESLSQITVTATHKTNSVVKTLTLTAAEGWKTEEQLPVGTYSLTQNAAAEGYTLSEAWNPQYKIVTVAKDEPSNVVITNTYKLTTDTDPDGGDDSDDNDGNEGTDSGEENGSTEATVPNVDPNGKIRIRTVDSRGGLWGGAKYGLFYGAKEIRSLTDYGTGIIDVSNPELVMGIYTESLVAYGAPMTLKQTRAPSSADGLSEKAYTVYMVQLEDGSLGLEVEGAEVAHDGTQIAEFSNTKTQPIAATTPASTDASGTIVIRTLDDGGEVLSGAQYCLSKDQYYDADEDLVYSEADRHGEITVSDLAQHVETGKKTTFYLMQSRQPENSKLSSDRFRVEVSKKNGKLDVSVKKDEGLLDGKTAGTVEEGDNGEWIVTFVSNQKTTTVNVTCNETVNWNDCIVVEDVLQNYKQSEYEFVMKWSLDGVEQEPRTLKVKNGETGSFEPIPNGARYEVLIPEDICAKGVFKKGQRVGTAATETVELEAELTYNIVSGDPLTIDMLRIDAQTEVPLSGAVYTLKNSEGDEVDTYKTRSDGKFLVDAITAPGEYTLTETGTPEGYSKIKKAIAINAALAFEEGTDAKGNPVIRQKLEAEVTHSMVKQLESGTYRIGTAQDEGSNSTVIIVAAAAAAVAAAGGAGALLLKRRGRKRKML